MNKKISLGVSISLMALAAAVTFILTLYFSLEVFNSKVNLMERTELNKRLEEIDVLYRSKYVGKIDDETLSNELARGYIAGTGDVYGHYYTPEEYQDKKLSVAGETIGVGITVLKDASGYILVESVREDSPANEAGILPEDIIVAVNGQDVLTLGYLNAVAAVSGDEGTVAKVTVRRNGEDTEYQLVRRRMDVISVTGRMISDTVGYIKITTFNNKTPVQFAEQVDALLEEGAEGLVFDVRNNGGGQLEALQGVLDRLLPADTIATATYSDGSTEPIVVTTGEQSLQMPFAVLINRNTASSAELFACALRDFGDARLVGVTTYGKGVMQTTRTLLDGGAVTLTDAHYQSTRTPNYDGVGLDPNFEVTLSTEEEANFKNLDETTDPQLKKAIEVVQ